MQFVIKPGYFEKKKRGVGQPGLDLSRVIGDFLVKQNIATTTDCCTYSLAGGGGVEAYETGLTGDTVDLSTDFSLTLNAAQLASFKLYLNGQRLVRGLDYTVTGSVITFITDSLVSDDVLLVEY